MKITAVYTLFLSMLLSCLFSCRRGEEKTIESTYRYLAPAYDLMQLKCSSDTLHFPLDEDTYNAIKSAWVFSSGGDAYIAFHDRRSESVNIYELQTRTLVKKLLLKKCFKDEDLYKTSVYVKNFDSIFIVNKATLNLLDTSGYIRESVEFPEYPRLAWAFFECENPLVIKGGKLYAAVRPYVKETSLKALRRWKVLYEFDLQNDDARLHYHLPGILRNDLYGYRFLSASYCYNKRGRFIFSFAGDTSIYETDLKNYHIAYYAKSRFHKRFIDPVTEEDLHNDKGFEKYITTGSYSAIYYDPFKNRYLRVARQAISEADYQAKRRKRKQSVIIFDENLKIIGESIVDSTVSFGTLFFTPDGSIYARVNIKDEYALHFVRLVYSDQDGMSTGSSLGISR